MPMPPATSLSRRESRKKTFARIGAAISRYKDLITINDADARSRIIPNPWRVVRGATGYTGMQIDTRPGLARKDNE